MINFEIVLTLAVSVSRTNLFCPSFLQVIVLESTSRFGGWLWSTRRSDGAVFEHGPRGIRPTGPVGRNTLNMVRSHPVISIIIIIITSPSSHELLFKIKCSNVFHPFKEVLDDLLIFLYFHRLHYLCAGRRPGSWEGDPLCSPWPCGLPEQIPVCQQEAP